MNQPEKSTKRIVSPAEYTVQRSKRAVLSLSGTLLVFAIWSGVAVSVFFCIPLILLGIVSLLSFPLIGVLLIGAGMGLGYLSIRGGTYIADRGLDIMQKAEDMDIGLPLTHVNPGDFSASESLVRASSEPVQEQESVLLRASIQSQQTPSDQLLRSVEE